MDLLNQFSVSGASYFTVKLIIFLIAVGYTIFTLVMGRQVQLMNRVLITPTRKVFSLIALLFTLSGVAISVLTFIALLR